MKPEGAFMRPALSDKSTTNGRQQHINKDKIKHGNEFGWWIEEIHFYLWHRATQELKGYLIEAFD